VTPAEAQTHAQVELVQAFLEGDERAFAELTKLHQPTLYRVVRRYAVSSDDAKDMAQKTLLRAFSARPRVAKRLRKEPQAFRAWLLRIAVNVGKNHARSSRLWRMEPVTALAHLEDLGRPPSADLEMVEERRRLRAAMLKLPPRQQEVVSLRVDGALSFAEIAEALDVTENNAVVNFHYAVRRLKALLLEEEP
jgi:RNA polymerase sigma-70 factor (ECF subfamily)